MATKQCRYCASDIPIQAIQCSVCKNYQSAWRNNLLFMAGLTGFITLVAGALSFSVNQASQLYKGLFWRDNLQIVEFETRTYPDFRVVLSNGGDGPVWASKIILYWPGGSHPFAIDRLVAVNGVETVDRGSKDYDSSKYAGFLGNTTGVASAAVLDSAHILPGDEHCFLA